VTTDDLSLLVAETRCAHGRLTLDDAERAGTGDDWIAYLRDPMHPCPYEVRDYAAYQTHAPHLPAAWLVPLAAPRATAATTARPAGQLPCPRWPTSSPPAPLAPTAPSGSSTLSTAPALPPPRTGA